MCLLCGQILDLHKMCKVWWTLRDKMPFLKSVSFTGAIPRFITGKKLDTWDNSLYPSSFTMIEVQPASYNFFCHFIKPRGKLCIFNCMWSNVIACISWKRIPQLPVYCRIYRYFTSIVCTLKETFSWNQLYNMLSIEF